MRILLTLIVASFFAFSSDTRAEIQLTGPFEQGGLVRGTADPGDTITLDGKSVRVGPRGEIVFGFHRDAPATAVLAITHRDGRREQRILTVVPRAWDIQRIDGLPPAQVTPPPEVLDRIKRDTTLINAAKGHDDPTPRFLSGFTWPASGRISGIFGSQRILNGEPRAPHYGMDIAAPVGAPITAPMDGKVTLAEPDLYFNGGTVILDHGHGLITLYVHMSRLDVKVGQEVRQGTLIGAVGKTGRATGPHLHWGLEWKGARLDPQRVLPPK